MKRNILFTLLFGLVLTACNKDNVISKNAEKTITKFIIDSVIIGKTIDSIAFYKMDSAFTMLNHHQSYVTAYDEYISNLTNLTKEITDYNYQKRVFREEYPYNGGLVSLYQDYIRENIHTINELKAQYKPKYIGLEYGVYAKYKTDFADSILIASYIVIDKTNNVMIGSIPRIITTSTELKEMEYKSIDIFMDSLKSYTKF